MRSPGDGADVVSSHGSPATTGWPLMVALPVGVVCIKMHGPEVAFETKLFVSRSWISWDRSALPAGFHAVMQYVKRVGLPDEFITATYSPDKGQRPGAVSGNTGKFLGYSLSFKKI